MATGYIDVLDTNRALVRVVPVHELSYWHARYPGFQFREHHVVGGDALEPPTLAKHWGTSIVDEAIELMDVADRLVREIVRAEGIPPGPCVALVSRYLELRGERW